jgi:aspartate racemase
MSVRASGLADPSLTTDALPRYIPRVYPGKVTLFLAADRPPHVQVISQLGWRRFAAGGFEVREIPGDHANVNNAQNGAALARALEDCLGQVRSGETRDVAP